MPPSGIAALGTDARPVLEGKQEIAALVTFDTTAYPLPVQPRFPQQAGISNATWGDTPLMVPDERSLVLSPIVCGRAVRADSAWLSLSD